MQSLILDGGQDLAPHRLDHFLTQARRHAASGLFRKVALLAMACCLGPAAASGAREIFNRFDEVRRRKTLHFASRHVVPAALGSLDVARNNPATLSGSPTRIMSSCHLKLTQRLMAMTCCLGPAAASGAREIFNRFDEVRRRKTVQITSVPAALG